MVLILSTGIISHCVKNSVGATYAAMQITEGGRSAQVGSSRLIPADAMESGTPVKQIAQQVSFAGKPMAF